MQVLNLNVIQRGQITRQYHLNVANGKYARFYEVVICQCHYGMYGILLLH